MKRIQIDLLKRGKNSYGSFFLVLTITSLLSPALMYAQSIQADSSLQSATIENCVQYALRYNPVVNNANLSEHIAESEIRTQLSAWYPQVNFNYNLQHNFQLPTINQNGNLVHTGSKNTSGAQFGITQNIFNRDVLLASRTANDVRLQAKQNTQQQKIDLAAMVSKAFYDAILTQQQIRVTDEDIQRIELSLKDSYYQYQGGIVDKTDYKRATINLNNAKAQRKLQTESLKSKYAYLKQLMGYPLDKTIDPVYDTAQMVKEIWIDTLQQINYSGRIEIQQLHTQKKLLSYNLQYYKWGFLPVVSAFGNYNLNFQNKQLTKIYNETYPNSFAGIALTFPIFQGGKRLQQIKTAQYQSMMVDNDILNLQNQINTQYQQALSLYKSNLFDYFSLKDNLSLANEVYDIIRLQYRSGVKTYLDVITSESDLRTAQINYYNALYQVLSNKIDVQQALGNIIY